MSKRLPLLAGLLLTAPLLYADEPEDKAVEAVKKWGGEYDRDPQNPAAPIIMDCPSKAYVADRDAPGTSESLAESALARRSHSARHGRVDFIAHRGRGGQGRPQPVVRGSPRRTPCWGRFRMRRSRSGRGGRWTPCSGAGWTWISTGSTASAASSSGRSSRFTRRHKRNPPDPLPPRLPAPTLSPPRRALPMAPARG
jgi:hypothetical protein